MLESYKLNLLSMGLNSAVLVLNDTLPGIPPAAAATAAESCFDLH